MLKKYIQYIIRYAFTLSLILIIFCIDLTFNFFILSNYHYQIRYKGKIAKFVSHPVYTLLFISLYLHVALDTQYTIYLNTALPVYTC